MSFKVYIIKCAITDKCYVSYTESPNPNYNPISYLYSIYKKHGEKYISLGESIEEHGLKNHKFTFLKTDLTKEQAVSTNEYLRKKLADRLLNDVYEAKVSFNKELALLEDDPLQD
jgi:hypothetical protein